MSAAHQHKRSEVVAIVDACERAGISQNRVAAALGISSTTISRWRERARRKPAAPSLRPSVALSL